MHALDPRPREANGRLKKTRFFKFTRWTPKLAYAVGAYLGDGSYDRWNQSYSQMSIDKEFLDEIRLILQEVLGSLPEVKKIIDPKKYKKPIYHFGFCCKDFCEWLVSITENKQHIPKDIPRIPGLISKSLCEGFLDAEGWVSKSSESYNKKGTFSFKCGFSCTDVDVVEAIAELLSVNGVTCHKWASKPTKNRIEYTYCINIRSFVRSGMRFHIMRKHNKMQEYLATVSTSKWKEISSTTERLGS
jgi:hypothetical protein